MDHDGYCQVGDTGQHVVISHMWQCYAGLFVQSRVISSFVLLQARITLQLPSVRVCVQCRQIQIPKVGADRNEEIIPANRLTQTTCRHYTHLH